MVDNNDSLFREVDEELRREQFERLWKRYGNYIVAAVVAIVVGVAGIKWWQAHKLAQAEAAGAKYEAAASLAASAKTAEAEKALEEIASTGPKGYATLAELTLAGAELKAGKPAEALQAFEKIVASGKADPILSAFARLQAAAIRLGEADFTEMENRLKPLTGDDNPWRFVAKEYLGLAALKAGKIDVARATLSPLLSDPLLPQGAAERIRRMMDTIATQELASGAAKAPEPAPSDEKKQAPAP